MPIDSSSADSPVPATAWLGVSQATVDDLVRLRVAPREKFRVIPIGLELERFTVANGDAGLAFREEVGAGHDDILFAYVGRCDAAMLTSDSEGTPVFLIEAAAAGRPALATAVGGVADVVHAGNGALVPRGGDGELADAIIRLSSDHALRRKMGARAREHVLKTFHAERLLTDVENLYEDLLESRNHSSHSSQANA